MRLNDMFPRRYATGADFNNKPVTLTISRVAIEQMRPQVGAPAVDKYVVFFENAEKGVILSKTLAYQIAEVIGSEETNDWVGHRVTLYPLPMRVAGKQRIAIRARKPKASNGDGPAPPSLAKDNEVDVDPATGEIL
jgi:hypothetical protein